MKCAKLYATTVFAVALFANAQEPSIAPANRMSPTQVQISAGDRERVEATLKKYEAAYQHMSLYELQNVWPDLPNQKKEYRKAEDLLTRGNVSSVRVALDVQDVQVNGDEAVAHALRHEQYLKNEQSSYYGADNSMGRVGTQTQGPVSESEKRTVKKTQEVTIKLHRRSDTWLIASLDESGKHH
jgi:hypothetical protein